MERKGTMPGGADMRSYTLSPHVADMRLHIEGNSLQELFLAGMEGMAQVLKKDFCQNHAAFPLEHAVLLTAKDTTALLVDFLSEVLTHSLVERAIFCRAEFIKLSAKMLHAKIYGIKINRFDKDIKAVTYHEAEVKRTDKNRYETVIVFDI